MLDPRVYRAASVPILFVLLVVAFSLQDRPSPARTSLAADAFAGDRALEDVDALARAFPVRRPGDAADEQVGRRVSRALKGAGFRVRAVRHSGQTIDGRRELRSVVAERTGASSRRIVVVAHRDAAGHPARAELTGTAVLLELGRVFGAPRRTRRTLTLVSTSGGSGGAAGAAALARGLDGPVDAVLVLGDLGARRLQAPLVVGWSNDLATAPAPLRSTVEDAVRVELGVDPGRSSALAQWARYAVPATVGEQGPLVAAGLPAVLLSGSGERPPAADAPVDAARLQAFGRATLRAVTALDGGPDLPATGTADLIAQRKVLPGWAIRLLVGALLFAPLVAMVDALARARRRREPVGPWVVWTLAGAVPFLLAACAARALGVSGLLPAAPAAPVDPAALPAQAPGLIAVALVFALGWAAVRPFLLRLAGVARGNLAAPGAALGVVIVVHAVAAFEWFVNPYAAALLVPAAHLWLFALVPDFRPSRAVGLALAAIALAPLLALAAWGAGTFAAGPGSAVWFVVLLVAGGHASPVAWLLWSLVLGATLGGLAVAWRGRARVGDDAMQLTMRGPMGYAGPGSLGGVESALRR